ncbi:MAG TPA: hypothetical protein VJ812_00050 [Gemmatimonadaceae bacterium]|nr:hypothetical protein [Gemmatimonadaceae bacterium]
MTAPPHPISRETLSRIPRDRLVSFLSGRRWFGAKGETPAEVRVAAVIPVLEPDERSAMAVVEVSLAGGPRRYLLPIVVRRRDQLENTDTDALIAELGDTDELVVDATGDARFRQRFAELLHRGARVATDDGALSLEPVSSGIAWPASPSRVGTAEQSNTSIIYGDRAILKLFRRLEPGESPDVEISRFLTTRTDFRNVPALLGIARLTIGDDHMVGGMVSEFLPGSGDAWSHALERVGAYLGAPRTADPPNPFAAEMAELGRVTRALHEALASHPEDPAFPVVPVGHADLDRWAESTRASIARGLDVLESQLRAGRLKGQTLAIAEATIKRRAGVVSRVNEVLADPRSARDTGRKTRHHGDYHLGQVLRTRDGRWMVIDFEGEPTRPLEERRAPNSPLRDVAGMLRSFAYAAASGAMTAGGLGRDSVLETRAARWERAARMSFVDAYLEAPPTATTPVPVADRDYVDGLVTLFEIEKVFYELAYELGNRPDWVWIPLRGIAKLF